jgi:chromosome segregation ATPase
LVNITDDKISLVNDGDAGVKIARNHFERKADKWTVRENQVKQYLDNNNYDQQLTFKTQAVMQPQNTKDKNLEEMLFGKNEQLSKTNDELQKKNYELEEKLLEKDNEVKNLSTSIEQLTEDYGKLTAKHNALLIYASDLQKKLDIYQIELVEKRDEILSFKKSDMGKIIQEKERLFKITEKELAYYKGEVNKLKSACPNSFTTPGNYKSDFKFDNHLLDNYVQENKRLKRLVYSS